MAELQVANIAAAIDEIQKENESLRAEIEELKREKEAAEEIAESEREKNKAFEPYADIIMEEDEGTWQEIKIRNPQTWKALQIKCVKVYGNNRPMSMASLVNMLLEYSLSKSVFHKAVSSKSAQNDQLSALRI